MVIWITGLSGAGKTTTAKKLVYLLNLNQKKSLHVDGDTVREIVADPRVAYDRDSRVTNAYRICRLAQEVEKQGFIAVVSTMSLFHEIHDWNRKNFKDYLEVYIDADKDSLIKRNSKQIYLGDEKRVANNVVGVHLTSEIPKAPDLILRNDREEAHLLAQVQLILEKIKEK